MRHDFLWELSVLGERNLHREHIVNNEVGAMRNEQSAARGGAFNWLGQLGRVPCLAAWQGSWLLEGKEDGSALYAEGAAYGGLWSTE